nr:hypothetical protein [Tanacetum cinerariifolium]
MKMYMKIIPDDEIVIDAIPLATKPPIIVDWKIIKGKISSYYLIRADGSSKRYSSMIKILPHINRQDLETLWKLVKAKFGNTRLEEGYERVLWGDLKSSFCEVSKSAYLYAGREKGMIVGIKRLHDDLRVTAAQITAAGRVYADRDEIKDLSEKRSRLIGEQEYL